MPPRSFNVGSSDRTGMERAVFLVAAFAVCVLAYAYCFHMYRTISFDEIGLHNPINLHVLHYRAHALSDARSTGLHDSASTHTLFCHAQSALGEPYF
jgi:hypothetical protein